jgi:cytochrome c biogenesis protein
LNDVYHAGWFRLLLLLLCVNLVICTIERLPKTLRLLKFREEHIEPQKLLKFTYHTEISTRLPLQEVQPRLEKLFSREFAALQPVGTADGFGAFAEKGRWSPFMVYIVHLSVLLILLGALLGSFFGFKGFMNLPEGEASSEVDLYRGQQSVTLPFQVRCDHFEASFYDTGAPKEFKSDLTILDQDREVLKRSIRVNDPLTYEGISFYQASYGSFLTQAEVDLSDRESGKTYKMVLPFRKILAIPGTQDKVEVVDYQQDLGRFGPAVAVVLFKEGVKEPSGSWILVKMPDFHGNRIGNYQVKITNTQTGQYTGLQVKRDPGIWMVYLGFIVMIAGVGLAFYTSHRKLWILASPGNASTKIIIAGRSNKNSLAFEQEFKRLSDLLQAEIE